jgi:hypothetical protein
MVKPFYCIMRLHVRFVYIEIYYIGREDFYLEQTGHC